MNVMTVTTGVELTVSASRFRELADLYRAAAESDYPSQIERAADLIGDAFEHGRKLLIFGNGGSASDAQHLAGEMVVRFQTARRALPAIALAADSAVLTACANDFCFADVFARQLQALGQPGDVALGISTSGKSANVLRGLQEAASRGLVTILLTGASLPASADLCRLVLCAPAPCTARVQELHLAAYHLICELIDRRFAGDSE